jgi:hypothetical protein
LEHGPDSRRSFKMLRALVWRSNDGLPIKMGSVVTAIHRYYRNRILALPEEKC